MSVLATYADLTTAIGAWEERTFTSTETDQFIALAEAKANRKLGQDFRRRDTASIAIDSDGLSTVPGGLVGFTSLVRDLVGSEPLVQVSWDALISRNPYETAGTPEVYALNGTIIRVSPPVADNFIAKFSAVLAGLSATNITNWLLALAPDYYLFAGQAAAAAKMKDYQTAALLNGLSDDILDQLVSQGMVAEHGKATVTIPGMTP